MTSLPFLIFAAAFVVALAGCLIVIIAKAGDGAAASAVHRLRKITPEHEFKRWDGTTGEWKP